MAVYLVERELRGITMAQLADAQRRAIDTSNEFSAHGRPVRTFEARLSLGGALDVFVRSLRPATAVRRGEGHPVGYSNLLPPTHLFLGVDPASEDRSELIMVGVYVVVAL